MIVHSERGFHGSEVSEVRLKQIARVGEVVGAHHLTNAVHAQLGHAQIHGTDACVGGEPK